MIHKNYAEKLTDEMKQRSMESLDLFNPLYCYRWCYACGKKFRVRNNNKKCNACIRKKEKSQRADKERYYEPKYQ